MRFLQSLSGASRRIDCLRGGPEWTRPRAPGMACADRAFHPAAGAEKENPAQLRPRYRPDKIREIQGRGTGSPSRTGEMRGEFRWLVDAGRAVRPPFPRPTGSRPHDSRALRPAERYGHSNLAGAAPAGRLAPGPGSRSLERSQRARGNMPTLSRHTLRQDGPTAHQSTARLPRTSARTTETEDLQAPCPSR